MTCPTNLAVLPFEVDWFAGLDLQLEALVVAGEDCDPIVQADFADGNAQILLHVQEKSSGIFTTGSGIELAAADVIDDSPGEGEPNFRAVLPGSAIPTAGENYFVTAEFVKGADPLDRIVVKWRINTRASGVPVEAET